jgi:hypothetical protein
MGSDLKNILSKYLYFSIHKPKKMFISENDNYQIIEINNDGSTISEVMTFPECTLYVIEKYKDQPLVYFNEYKRLKIIHLKTGTVKDVKLKIDF